MPRFNEKNIIIQPWNPLNVQIDQSELDQIRAILKERAEDRKRDSKPTRNIYEETK